MKQKEILPSLRFRAFSGFRVIVVTALLVLAGGSLGAKAPETILATPERLLRIHQGLLAEHPHFMGAYHLLVREMEEQDDPLWRDEGDNWSYGRSYKAQKEAFLYALSGDSFWADRAYRTLRTIYEDPDPDGRFAEKGNSGLSRATVGLGFALAYNWCYAAWDEEQRTYIRDVLERSLEMWEDFFHHNFGADRGSNWVAVCRGVELMQILALGWETEREERYDYLVQELLLHARNGFDRIGASQEGIGYTSYGAIFLIPAAVAAADRGDFRLLDFLRAERQWHKQLMYSGSFARVPGLEGILSGSRVFTFSGVGGPNTNDQGFASVVMALPSSEKGPIFQWWYDRHMGYRSGEFGGVEKDRFEPQRQGRIWALLFHPGFGEPEHPEQLSRRMVTGEQGRYFFRNRWQNVDDVLISFHKHVRHHPRAWAQAEVGALSIFAYDTLFLSGPRTNREARRYNRLLVNGNRGHSTIPGLSLYADEWEELGIYAMGVNGTRSMEDEDVLLYERHVLVALGTPGDNDAVVITLDRARTREEGTFTWNAYTGMEERLGGWSLEAETRTVGDWSGMLLRGETEGVMQGVVLEPGNVSWQEVEGSWQLEKTGREAEFLVALGLHPENPPEVKMLSEDEEGTDFQVGNFSFRWDRKENRLRPLLD